MKNIKNDVVYVYYLLKIWESMKFKAHVLKHIFAN